MTKHLNFQERSWVCFVTEDVLSSIHRPKHIVTVTKASIGPTNGSIQWWTLFLGFTLCAGHVHNSIVI